MPKRKTTEWGDWFHGGDPDAAHERLGNSWWSWMYWVFVLEQSADHIWENSYYVRTKGGQTQMPMQLCACAMLMAYAIECALKALWVRRGNRLVINGRYVGIRGARDHQLVQLASVVGFTPTRREAAVLDHFTKAAMFVGRYPIAKGVSDMLPYVSQGGDKTDVAFFSPSEFRTATSLTNKILRLVSGKKRSAFPRRRLPARIVDESGGLIQVGAKRTGRRKLLALFQRAKATSESQAASEERPKANRQTPRKRRSQDDAR